jgi:hypothetical protein
LCRCCGGRIYRFWKHADPHDSMDRELRPSFIVTGSSGCVSAGFRSRRRCNTTRLCHRSGLPFASRSGLIRLYRYSASGSRWETSNILLFASIGDAPLSSLEVYGRWCDYGRSLAARASNCLLVSAPATCECLELSASGYEKSLAGREVDDTQG